MDRDLKLDLAEKNLFKSKSKKNKKSSKAEIWSITSGKGGVGKTFITSSLGITLTKLGHSVVIIDLDLSGANIHTALGLKPSHLNLRHYFDKQKTLSETVIPTMIPHLSYVQGLWDSWAPTEYSVEQLKALIDEAKELKTDYVLIDLGAGATEAHLEVLKRSDEKILVTNPEPTSIEKNYRFIESYICSSMKDYGTPAAYDELIKTLRDYRQKVLQSPFSFREYFKTHLGFEVNYFEKLSEKPLRLLVNGSRSHTNSNLGYSIKSVSNKYYDVSLDYMGAIDYDNAVWQSVKNMEPVLIAQPFTTLTGQFLSICKHMIDPEELRAVI